MVDEGFSLWDWLVIGVGRGVHRPGDLPLGPEPLSAHLKAIGSHPVDARAEMALAEMVRAVVSADLDELHARVEQLEQQLLEPRSFSYREHVAQRRWAVVELRASGL